MTEWGIGVIKIVIRWFEIQVVWNTCKAIKFWNARQISFAVILPNGFDVPRYQRFIYMTGNAWGFYYFEILCSYSYVGMIFHYLFLCNDKTKQIKCLQPKFGLTLRYLTNDFLRKFKKKIKSLLNLYSKWFEEIVNKNALFEFFVRPNWKFSIRYNWG